MNSIKALIFFGLISITIGAQSSMKKNKAISRITNGNKARRHQFPYQAGLGLYTHVGYRWCGGSVISKCWILSAAHCLDDLTTGIDVHLGAWNRTDLTEEGQQRFFVPISSIILHEGYGLDSYENDIALIRLPTPIKFNKYIQSVRLPNVSLSNSTFTGEYGIASGWGYTSDVSFDHTDILRYIRVPIMRNSVCKSWWLKTVIDSNVCIETTGGTSTCFGDSGGPLVLNSIKGVLIGVSSFGNTRCEVGVPDVFTRVTHYLDWIKNHTAIAC